MAMTFVSRPTSDLRGRSEGVAEVRLIVAKRASGQPAGLGVVPGPVLRGTPGDVDPRDLVVGEAQVVHGGVEVGLQGLEAEEAVIAFPEGEAVFV